MLVLSDFYDRGGFAPALDIFVIMATSRGGADFRSRRGRAHGAGDVELFDVETGTARQVTITGRMAARYRVLVAEFHDDLRRYCGRRGIPHTAIDVTMPEGEILRKVILGR